MDILCQHLCNPCSKTCNRQAYTWIHCLYRQPQESWPIINVISTIALWWTQLIFHKSWPTRHNTCVIWSMQQGCYHKRGQNLRHRGTWNHLHSWRKPCQISYALAALFLSVNGLTSNPILLKWWDHYFKTWHQNLFPKV